MEIRPSTTLSVKPSPKSDEGKAAAKSSEGGLKSAAANNQDAGAAIADIAAAHEGMEDVERANEEAARASLRDVEAAAELAGDLARRIVTDAPRALAAQANQETDDVERLLA